MLTTKQIEEIRTILAFIMFVFGFLAFLAGRKLFNYLKKNKNEFYKSLLAENLMWMPYEFSRFNLKKTFPYLFLFHDSQDDKQSLLYKNLWRASVVISFISFIMFMLTW
jgi:hypothetical protein